MMKLNNKDMSNQNEMIPSIKLIEYINKVFLYDYINSWCDEIVSNSKYIPSIINTSYSSSKNFDNENDSDAFETSMDNFSFLNISSNHNNEKIIYQNKTSLKPDSRKTQSSLFDTTEFQIAERKIYDLKEFINQNAKQQAIIRQNNLESLNDDTDLNEDDVKADDDYDIQKNRLGSFYKLCLKGHEILESSQTTLKETLKEFINNQENKFQTQISQANALIEKEKVLEWEITRAIYRDKQTIQDFKNDFLQAQKLLKSKKSYLCSKRKQLMALEDKIFGGRNDSSKISRMVDEYLEIQARIDEFNLKSSYS
ncbi:uncharacterized protein LOC135924941 isoform X2 [Gordionus sp. m RMFG-2023]|uniref:uncharacterized protein LOC135924941 isoform X2 n=1 Tax=Gordionus sp. m RMFG-2023 TaxID=3053472 RepID=UPI0031FC8088